MFCSSDKCGPCDEGEGDCDPGQCLSGFECEEEGVVDRCRHATSGGKDSSNFQVRLNGEWKGICCNGGRLEVSARDCTWTEDGRVLTDESADLTLDCPEGRPKDCVCNATGERMHGLDGHVNTSITLRNGAPIFSNNRLETCVVVGSKGELKTEWTDSSCPHFRLQ